MLDALSEFARKPNSELGAVARFATPQNSTTRQSSLAYLTTFKVLEFQAEVYACTAYQVAHGSRQVLWD